MSTRLPAAVPPRPATHPALIADDLERVEAILARSLGSERPQLALLLQHLRHYRGKRLRPMLLLLAAKACGEVRPAHHVLAAVVEMIHTATLVHDDVLDEAALRRHAPTVNASWGNKRSILLGDFLFTHAFHLCSTLGDARACEWVGEATNRVCAGELLQMAERGNLELGEADYFAMIEGKTAALTECCCRLGAAWAGASEEVTGRLADYGRWLGIAFQIADDLLDLVGTEKTAGKTLGTDLEQQKLTLPLIHMLDRVPAEEAARLRGVLANGCPDKRAAIEAALAGTKALGYAKRRAEEFAGRARAALGCLPDSPARGMLEQLTEWAVRREQ